MNKAINNKFFENIPRHLKGPRPNHIGDSLITPELNFVIFIEEILDGLDNQHCQFMYLQWKNFHRLI